MKEYTDTKNNLLLREYKKLFTGTNQYEGYDKPFLGYETKTHSIVLKKDNMTYFNTPVYSSQVAITAAALIENGAIKGTVPYYSDRVYSKTKDCIDITNIDLAQRRSYNAIYLCTWLSGNPVDVSTPPIWVDRYYNPDCIDETNAHRSTNTQSVSDYPSLFSFNPTLWYAYYHIGEKTVKTFTDELSASGALKINLLSSGEKLTNNSSTSISIIESNNEDSQYITQYSERNEKDENIVYYDNTKKQSFNIPFDPKYTPSGSFTANIWVKFNTLNFPGKQIIGQGFRDGWSITYTNNFYTPIMFFTNNSGQLTITYNTDGDALNRSETINIINPVKVMTDNDSFGWVLDNGVYQGSKHLYKLDYEGNVINKASFNSLFTLKDFKINKDHEIVVLLSTGTQHQIQKYDRFCNLLSSSNTATSNFLEIDLNNNPVTGSTSFIINSKNEAYNYNQIKNICIGLSGLNISDVIDFNIDRYDNIWVLDKNNTVYKINDKFDLKLTYKIQTATIQLTQGSVNFSYELNYNTEKYEDYIWFLCSDDGSLYKYNQNGVIIKKIPIKNFDINTPISNGDFTNYQWSRKFNYLRFNKTPQIKASFNLATTTNSPSANRYDLYFPETFINDNDWHMITIMFDKHNTTLSLYLDGIIRDTTNVDSNEIMHYSFDSGIVFGASCGKNDSFENTIRTDQDWFKGYLYNFKMYHSVIPDYLIQYLHLERYIYEDITWFPEYNTKSYLEEIERFFMHKMPGSKSQFYNINLIGLKITDPDLRIIIEDIIKQTVKKITPAHSILYKIKWDSNDGI